MAGITDPGPLVVAMNGLSGPAMVAIVGAVLQLLHGPGP